LQKKLEQLQLGKRPRDPKPLIQELLETTLPGFERDLRRMQKNLETTPAALRASQSPDSMPAAALAIIAGEQKYTKVPVLILAIFAVPHDLGAAVNKDPAARAVLEARDEETTGAQAKAFESGLPSARVVRLPHASHYVFVSNEADVLREMNAFFGSLP
jgi:non-heme chloroperoxidase